MLHDRIDHFCQKALARYRPERHSAMARRFKRLVNWTVGVDKRAEFMLRMGWLALEAG